VVLFRVIVALIHLITQSIATLLVTLLGVATLGIGVFALLVTMGVFSVSGVSVLGFLARRKGKEK